MEYVRLGGSGVEVSALCLGTWMFGTEVDEAEEVTDEETAHQILDAAWESGVTFFDTANNYGDGDSERYLGSWLENYDRESFVVASKVYFDTHGRQGTGLSRKIVRAEIEGTLERLGTDYLDLYYIHGWHEESPIEETMAALNDLVREGRVHYLGVSNFAAWQLLQAQGLTERHDWAPISVIQPRYNALDHYPYTVDPAEQPLPGLLDACRDQDIAMASYAPLAGGFLTGKYGRGPDGNLKAPEGTRGALLDTYGPFTDRAWNVLEAVQSVAEEVGATPAQVALRWVMDAPGVTSIPIAGATSPAQLEENAAAVELSVSSSQYDRIARAGRGGDDGSWPVYES